MYILGLPLLENYYTVFDQQQKKIGFARSIYSDQDPPLLFTSLSSDSVYEQNHASLPTAVMIAAVPVIVWIIALIAYRSYRNN